jgi:hypothetical protein
VRTAHLDPRDLTTAGAVMLGAAVVLPLLPGHPGLACPLRTMTGVPCPLCGMTTSVIETVHLDLGAAFAANPAGILAVLAALVLLAVRPRRLTVPTVALPLALAALWVFQLNRFDVL